MTAFTLGDVARICKVSPARLRYWERTELLRPARGRDAQPAFAFEDLVSIKTLIELLRQGVPLRRIRSSVDEVRQHLPEIDRPLGALRVWLDGSERVVVRHEGVLLEPDGQMVIDFSVPASDGVALLARPDPAATATAEAYFEQGCKLDSDRATYADAITAYTRALEADPEFADAWCNLGSIYFNPERRAAARACFERALDLEPGHLEANLNLATLLEDEGRDEPALRHYKAALVTDPMCADAHVSIALLYEKLGLRRRARGHWRRYLGLDPGGTWAEMAKARLDS